MDALQRKPSVAARHAALLDSASQPCCARGLLSLQQAAPADRSKRRADTARCLFLIFHKLSEIGSDNSVNARPAV
jgi:hypothetical protein